MTRQLWIALVSTTLGAGLWAPGCDAQLDGDKGQQAESQAGDHRWVREWANKELQDAPRRSERLKALVDAIDSGSPPETIRKLMLELRATRRGGGGPGPDPMGGPGGDGARPSDSNESGLSSADGGFPGRRGMGSGRGAPGNNSEPQREPTEEDYQAAQEFVQATAPQLFKAYEELRVKDPAAAKAKLREAFPRIQHLLDMRRNDPEMFALKIEDIRHGREAFDAGRRIVEFDRDHPEGEADPQRQELLTALRNALSQQYDIRGRIIDREVQALEKDLLRRRDELARRPDAKQSVVDKTAEEIVRRIKNWRPGKGRGARGEDAQPHPSDEPGGPRGRGGRDRSRDD